LLWLVRLPHFGIGEIGIVQALTSAVLGLVWHR
jgi:hypothetical protein